MRTIGAFEAKTHLSEILEKASQGEETLITRRGIPIAKIIPVEKDSWGMKSNLLQEFKQLRKKLALGNLYWRDLRDEGRK